MIFYRRRVREVAPAASFDVIDKEVDYGYIRKIERVVAINKTADAGELRIYISGHGYKHYVDTAINLGKKPVAPVQVVYTLRESESLGFEITGVTAGDEIEIYITGYDIPQ